MSSLQLIRNQEKLAEAAHAVLRMFGFLPFESFMDPYLKELNLRQSEELIRELKAILDG